MKKTKIIIPAMGLLLLSTAASVSSTVAWFAMNSSVSATNMQIKAKTDNAYLIIKQGTVLSGNDKTAASSLNVELYPVKPVVSLTSSNIETLASWGTATSTDPNDPNSAAVPTALSEGTLLGNGNYVAKEQFRVGILQNSGTPAYPLTLDTVTFSNVNAGLTAVVVCGTNVYSHNANVAAGGTEILATANEVAVSGGVQIDVYLYIDGSNANVYTSNAANLSGSLSLVFSIGHAGA